MSTEYVWDRRTDPERLDDPNYGLCPLRNPVNGDLVAYCNHCGAVVWDEYLHDEFHARRGNGR